MLMMALAMEMVTTMPTTARMSVAAAEERMKAEAEEEEREMAPDAATDEKAKVVMVTALAL